MKYSIIFLAFALTACSQQSSISDRLSYDIQIDYMDIPNSDTRELTNDTLFVLFDGNLFEDTIDVMINNRHFKQTILSTDEIEGNAGHLATIPYMRIENIGFRINKGKLIYIEPEKDHYNIRLTYLNNRATVRFYKFFPSYR